MQKVQYLGATHSDKALRVPRQRRVYAFDASRLVLRPQGKAFLEVLRPISSDTMSDVSQENPR